MGETDCLTQPFSYISGVINEAEGNPLPALGESISFGRFTSETLAWERWSSFSRNHYVEEAKKYSQPGSVAQKKAFFEAHYKSIAAKKAAALLEQENVNANANAAANDVPEPEFVDASPDITAQDSRAVVSSSSKVVDRQPQVDAPNTEADCTIGANGQHFNVADDKLEGGKVEEADPVTESQVLSENSMNCELPARLGETSSTLQLKKPILKSSNWNHESSALMSKKKLAASSKSSVYGKSRFPSSPAKPTATNAIHLRKENNASPGFNSKSEVSTLMKKMKPAVPSSKSLVYRAAEFPSSPAKLTAAFHLRKEINATPVSIKSTLDSWDRKRSTPKALHISVNITPAREHNIQTTPAPRNIGSLRVSGAAASKASTYCTTPLGTPTTVSSNGAAKHHLTTPQSETRRAKTPLHTMAPGSRTTGPKCCSNSSTPFRNRWESPIFSSPFSFKTEERAAKRKEKLEGRLDAKEAHRVLLQTKFKEKAETELRKLRQSLCFKARPLPEFYKERRTTKDQTKKGPVKHSQSLSIVQGSTCLPPRKPSTSSSSKLALEKNGQTTSSHSLTKMVTHENTSPNIQQ